MSLPLLSKAKSLKGKRVLLRLDLNVPLKKGKVAEDSRILASLETLNHLRTQGAKVIIITHLGRPKGEVVEDLRLDVVAKRLSKIGEFPVQKVDQYLGEEVEHAIAEMNNGDVIMLENIRFAPEEKKDSHAFGKKLAALGDVYVSECFAVAHRKDASVVEIAKHLPHYIGFLFEQEIRGLNALIQGGTRPFVALLGGTKLATKIPLIEGLLEHADRVLIGGALVNTYLKGNGYVVGDSVVDEGELTMDPLRGLSYNKIMLPMDLVIGKPDGSDMRVIDMPPQPEILCEEGEGIFDIGPKTARLYDIELRKAKRLLWNGAMGYFEQKPYDKGTRAIAKAVAKRAKEEDCFAVAGGGETLQSLHMIHAEEDVDFVSTGGGAMLAYLANTKLPGIAAMTT